MREWQLISLLGIAPICWMVGGGIEGVHFPLKWIRRMVWPLAAAALLVVSRTSILSAALTGLLLAAVLTLPYGDHLIWPLRILVFMVLPAPALAINLHAWPVVLGAGIMIVGMAAATRTWNWVNHKLFESFCGFIQASTLVCAVLMK